MLFEVVRIVLIISMIQVQGHKTFNMAVGGESPRMILIQFYFSVAAIPAPQR